MTRYSIISPLVPARPEHLLPLAAMVGFGAPHRLWQGQALHLDPYQCFTHLAGSGFRIPVGMGVTLMPMRHPYEAALQARSLATIMGHPVVAGFGPGATRFQQSVLGAPYRSQLGLVREYATIVGALLRDGRARHAGEFFDCHVDLPPLPHPGVELGLGVLRPAMAELAGRLADVAITWLAPPRYLADVVVPALDAGAAAAGRSRPRIAAVVSFCLDAPGRDPVQIVLAAHTAHLRLPHYQDMLRRSGIEVDAADPGSTAKRLLADGAVVTGDIAEVTAGIRRYVEAGVDEVVLNVGGLCAVEGLAPALRDLETVFGALG